MWRFGKLFFGCETNCKMNMAAASELQKNGTEIQKMFKFFVEVVYEGETSKFCQGHLEVVLLIKPKTVQLLKKS